MHSKSLLILVATLFADAAALAQSPASVDRNGPLSRLDQQFKAADKDGDGALTRVEAEAAGMGRVVRHFDRVDGNKDGKVTRDELRAIIRTRLSM